MEVNGKLICAVFIWLIKIFEFASLVGGKQLENSIWSQPNLFSSRRTHIGPAPFVNDVMTEWSSWAMWQSCSRSCGGGIRSRKRKCTTRYPRVMPGSGIRTTHDRCTGDTLQYEVCESQTCPRGAGVSFRAIQCREQNNKKVLGRVVNNWVPYNKGGMNPCALVCEGEGEGLVYTFGKVTDGTHCTNDEGKKGMCVNGRCLRLSCDGKLGGEAEEDMCRVCGGRNDTCIRHRGVYHSDRPLADQPQNAPSDQKTSKTPKNFGYYEVVTIPKGSTNVRVFENSSNFLALRSGGKYFLNGDWLIDWPGDVDANGITFSYARKEDQSESLTSLGPTNGDLALMVLLREHNPGIFYEYWTPNLLAKFALLSTTSEPSSGKANTQIIASPKVRDPKTRVISNTNLKPAVLTELTLNQSLQQKHQTFDDVNNDSSELVSNSSIATDKENKMSFLRPQKLVALNLVNYNVKDKASYKRANSVLSRHHKSKRRFKHKNKLKFPPLKTKKKKNNKKKKKKGKKRFPHCRRCLKRRKAKQSFCTSDFVSRIEVLNAKVVSNWVRLEVLVLQSYKNKVPLLHKEFLWQDMCHCRRLRRGKSYIVMGTSRQGRGNEVRLTLGETAYVKRFSAKILSRVMKIRRNEMRYCRKWRLKSTTRKYSDNNYLVNLVHKRQVDDKY